MKPFEVMVCSLPELLSFIDGYYIRLGHYYRQARVIGYAVYCLSTPETEREDVEDWWPMWFDGSKEERGKRAEIERIKQGMVAEKDIEHYRSLGIDL